jgi:WG containing repeat
MPASMARCSKSLAITACLVVLTVTSVSADVLVTQSGRRHEGTVTEKGDSYVLERPNGSSIVYPKSMVREVIRDEPVSTAPTDESQTSDSGDGAKPRPAVGLFPVKQNGKWGYIDHSGTVRIAPLFDLAMPFREGLAHVKTGNEVSFIDDKGKKVLRPEGFDTIAPFAEGMARVLRVKDGSAYWGFINREGKTVVKPELGFAWSFTGGLSAACPPYGKWGYINKKGVYVIKPAFLEAWDFSEGLARVRTGNKPSLWGYIDKRGNWVVRPKFSEAGDFAEGLAPVQFDFKKWGYIDNAGKTIIEPQYDHAGEFSEGLAKITVDVWGSNKFEAMGRVFISALGKTGYIDRTGKQVIKPQFADAEAFSEGLACVRVDKIDAKYGFIDKEGTLVIQPRFDEAESFSQGLAKVTVGGKVGYIDKTGKYVWTPSD